MCSLEVSEHESRVETINEVNAEKIKRIFLIGKDVNITRIRREKF